MKTIKLRLLFAGAIALSIFAISCANDDDSMQGQPNPQVIDQIESNVANGSWIITKFDDSGEDETDHFTGYSFTFNSNGVLTADNGVNTYEGTWSITDSDNSDDDDSSDDIDFNINFDLTNDFEDLNEDWDILTHSSTKIEFRDVSGGNGGTDLLTFEKN